MDFLGRPGREDYAVVDLQRGQSWLTSRLYLFTSLLTRMRGIRCVVFVATSSPQTYVGLADPQQLLWSLAAQQPWLEQAYALALTNSFLFTTPTPSEANIRPTEANGRLNTGTAMQLAYNFLKDPNIQVQANASPWLATESVQLPKTEPVIFEHATWLDPQAVTALLGTMLVTEPVVYEPGNRSEREQLQAIITHPPAPRQPAFVPVLDPNGQFLRLQDRAALVNAVAESAMRLSASG